MLSRVLVLVAITSVALAAVARQELEKKPEEYENCDGCWISDLQIFLPIGGSWPSPTKCMEYHCTETHVEMYSCGVVAVAPPCYVVRDDSLYYPNCCSRPFCPPKA